MINVPDGLKHALHMGANEVFMEWFDSVLDDPTAVIAGTDLGTTYQSIMSPDVMPEADARRMLKELSAWDDGSDDGTHAGAVRHFEDVYVKAGLDFARGLISLATGEGDVPDRVVPYEAELAPLVDQLEQALADGAFDETSVDLHELIWS